MAKWARRWMDLSLSLTKKNWLPGKPNNNKKQMKNRSSRVLWAMQSANFVLHSNGSEWMNDWTYTKINFSWLSRHFHWYAMLVQFKTVCTELPQQPMSPQSCPWMFCLFFCPLANFDRDQCVVRLQWESNWLLDHLRVLLLRHNMKGIFWTGHLAAESPSESIFHGWKCLNNMLFFLECSNFPVPLASGISHDYWLYE